MKLDIITDAQEIAERIPTIRDTLNREYAYFGLGKWNGPVSNRYLIAITTEIKIVSNEQGMAACAIYAGNFGGNKTLGVAGVHTNPEYRKGVAEIIKSDKWYWVEASGAIEHYFKKNNGYPIPCEYSKNFIKRPIERECPDGFHFERMMGPDQEIVKKCVFGFPSNEDYLRVTQEFADYEGFRKKINNESNGDNTLEWARYVVGNIEEMFLEFEVNEMPKQWSEDLKSAIRILQENGDDKLAAAGELLLESMPELELIHVPG